MLCTLTTASYSQSIATNESIKELMELTGSGKLGVQMGNQLIEIFKKNYPDMRSEFWDGFEKEFTSDTFQNMVIPIYKKYYSEDDVKQLIAFYKSPIGKKVTASTPQIMQESMEAGQKWGAAIGAKVYERITEQAKTQSED